MKLYFYALEQNMFNVDAEIKMYECEVIKETEKRYYLQERGLGDKFPYRSRIVDKRDIKKITMYSYEILVLTEKDDIYAMEVFENRYKEEISNKEFELNLWKENLKHFKERGVQHE